MGVTTTLRRKLRTAIAAAVPQAEQGRHIDPIDEPAPDPSAWGATCTAAIESPEMETFRAGLRLDDRDVRASVLDDLATFHGITPEEARARCLDWEQDSLAEWAAVEDPVAFYRTMQSWGFDLLWWAYLQATGHADPSHVIALRWLRQHTDYSLDSRKHLDFGSGVGVTSQLFADCGYETTLADLSSTLLGFARFRLERRGVSASYLDLGTEALPNDRYDVITAIDTLAHVPDLASTGRELHAALRPGGVLIANFDIREEAPETVWHLQDDDLRATYELRRAGFVSVGGLGYGLVAYRSVHDSGIKQRVRAARDWLTLVSPPRRLARRLGRPMLRAAGAHLERRRRGHAPQLTPALAPALQVPAQRTGNDVDERSARTPGRR
ncbi:class I SAM-dependent methyltransferase [Pseudonocardia sp. TRM90224]|uniref:class I SAM-dependent methyltransferase n=1 Tax=Pseudonocardia sp. TRM90224 TaxID=2812678 RepID=UPI001E2FD9AB|nr:class I SAM-dependent methyltransferase [Pseudonocardia sp. TRM90224]